MKKSVLNILLAATLLVSFSCGNKSGQGEDSKEVAEDQNEEKFEDSSIERDTEFAVAAADGGMMEVELGKLAQTNASSAQVKQFAQMMIDDHSKANEELIALAQQKNITLPSSLSDKKRKKYDDFAEKKGEEFDKDYIDFMVDDHKDDIDKFEKQADKGNDADLKAWASGKLPTLRHHLEMAQQAKDAVKDNNSH
jgi:putative membrane protein